MNADLRQQLKALAVFAETSPFGASRDLVGAHVSAVNACLRSFDRLDSLMSTYNLNPALRDDEMLVSETKAEFIRFVETFERVRELARTFGRTPPEMPAHWHAWAEQARRELGKG